MTAAPAFDLADAEWLAHRYVESDDAVRFIHLPRAEHERQAFLIDTLLGDRPTAPDLPAPDLLALPRGRLHFLFHSAFCGSTLLVRALFLYAPLETFLVSVARKGLHCRAWVRELLEGYVQDRFIDLGFAPEDYFRLTDLQVAAVGWLAQHRHFTALAGKHGDRIASLDADLLTARPEAAIAAVAAHYGLALDAAAVAAGPAFARNSKSGAAYSPEARSADYQAARAAYGEEIAMVVTWAEAVAANVGLALAGPNPLAVQA